MGILCEQSTVCYVLAAPIRGYRLSVLEYSRENAQYHCYD